MSDNGSDQDPMLSFASVLLYVIHCIYALLSLFSSVKIFIRQTPLALDAPRKRIPNHLALILVSPEDVGVTAVVRTLMESVETAVKCCRTVGIERLTVYDRHGILMRCSQDIRERVAVHHDLTSESSDSDVEYPLTPPVSRPLSPAYDVMRGDLGVVTIDLMECQERRIANVLTRRREHLHRKPFILHLVSRESSKVAIAAATRSLVRTQRNASKNHICHNASDFNLSIELLGSILEGEHGVPSPDLMMLHSICPTKYNCAPIELHGFPPWQIRLTEIFDSKYHGRFRSSLGWFLHLSRTVSPLDELQFREALDEFAKAEMRLGK